MLAPSLIIGQYGPTRRGFGPVHDLQEDGERPPVMGDLRTRWKIFQYRASNTNPNATR